MVNQGNKDPLVVRTAELSAVLSLWLSKHNGRFPNGHDGVFTGGYDYIMYLRPELTPRQLYRIVAVEAKHTFLRIADDILTAIDEQGALQDGRIEVIPNPRWNHEKWLAWKAEQGCI